MEACRILAGSIEHLCQSAQVGRKGTISVFIRGDTVGAKFHWGGGGGDTITVIDNCIGDHYPILLKKYMYIAQVRNSIGDINFCRVMILA